MLKVKNLYHRYAKQEKDAVKGISFEISKGEIFGFLGPNGAGKSTTQKILTGLLPLQKGEASLAGIDIKKPTEKFYSLIGVSFEQPNFYKKLTGYENLDFYRKMFPVPTEDPKNLLNLVGLEHAANKRSGDYSKGMQQRLVFARSLINKPQMWFLDEPISGLDPTTASHIKELIWKKKQKGVTIFLTTHNMHIADELCDQVAFINEGNIELIDSPRNLKLKYGKKLVYVEYKEKNVLKKEHLSMTTLKDQQKLNHLILAGTIETMHSQEASLEEIFTKVTGRGLK
ncbi:ABC transporter ATP-binding protein [Clostridiaceae bacterium 35-E11]